MPNETENTPIVEPLSATEGVFDLDQSGHKAFSKDKAPSKNSSENPYKTLGTLKLSFTMTGEEALNELRYGKKGTPESLAAVNLLAAKAVERFGDGDNNFLTKYSGWNDWKGLLRNNGNDWEVAAHLLGADVKQVVNDQPWKMKAFDRLADSALTLRVASGLTEKYVNGTLRKDSDKEQYNKFSPELRRQLLRQYGTPAELPAWFDQTIASPSTPNRPAPKVTVQTPSVPISRSHPHPIDSLVDDEDTNTPTELEKIAFEYLNKLTEEQRGYLMGSFDEADLIVAAQRLNQVSVLGAFQFMFDSRSLEGGRIVFFSPGTDGKAVREDSNVLLREMDDFWGNEERVNKALDSIQTYLDRNGLTLDQYMAFNMMAYSTEESAYIQNDFEFKKQLYDRYNQDRNIPITILNSEQEDDIDEEAEEVVSINIPGDIADGINDIRGNFRIPVFLSGNDGTNPTIDVYGDIDPEEFTPYQDDDDVIPNQLLDSNLRNLNIPREFVQQTLLTRDIMIGEDENDPDLLFENKIRLALWQRYQELNSI